MNESLILNSFFTELTGFQCSLKNGDGKIKIVKKYLDYLLFLILKGKENLIKLGYSYERINDDYGCHFYELTNGVLKCVNREEIFKETIDVSLDTSFLGDFINSLIKLKENDKTYKEFLKDSSIISIGSEHENILNKLLE